MYNLYREPCFSKKKKNVYKWVFHNEPELSIEWKYADTLVKKIILGKVISKEGHAMVPQPRSRSAKWGPEYEGIMQLRRRRRQGSI